jgi:hypothetical protein
MVGFPVGVADLHGGEMCWEGVAQQGWVERQGDPTSSSPALPYR